jgi:hypothetical protein
MFHIVAHKTSRPDQGRPLLIFVGNLCLTLIQASRDHVCDPDDIGVEFAEIVVVPRPVEE